jgi:hypothetical protein
MATQTKIGKHLMQTEKIVNLHTNDDVQLRYGKIESTGNQVFHVIDHAESYIATRAFSCIVEPIPGDTVMFSKASDRRCHIQSIIYRPDSTDASLTFPGNVSLNVEQGQFSLNAQEGIAISSAQCISQTSEEYTLIANKGLFSIDNLSAIGTKLIARVSNVQTYSDTLETVAGNLLQKLKNSFRLIEGVDQSRSRDVINTVENLYSMRSTQTAILAKKDIKIDAERIHMG